MSMSPSKQLHSEDKENVGGDYEISADPSKYVTLPVQNEEIWVLYQSTLQNFWTVHDVYVAGDKKSVDTTFPEENQRQTILQILAFMFTTHYTTINKDLFMQLMSQVDIKEASYYYGSQADAKKTHSMMYSMLLDEILHDKTKHPDSKRKEILISDVVKMPHVRDFLRWSILNINAGNKSFAQRQFAFATLQGIVFACPFLLFNWLQRQNPSVMPGLVNSNELIWRDEKLNLEFTATLFKHIDEKLTEQEAHQIVKEAVQHSKNLFIKSMPVSILGMDCRQMEQWIEHLADVILVDFKFNKLYNSECPFNWVETESETAGNKFKALDKSIVASSLPSGPTEFKLDDNF